MTSWRNSMANKQQLLDEIAADILKQNVCPDLANQATQMVFGDGNINAKLVFIGEAPGKQEDLQGKPFVGASGKFLNEMLASVSMDRSDVYITNIVKYRPPNNRDPLPEEKKAFLPFLQRQLEVIQPKVVITLGRHSTNCFLPDAKISQDHGKPKKIRIAFKGHAGDDGLSAMQGKSEQRSKRGEKPSARAEKDLTQQRTKKTGSASSLAAGDDSLAVVILPLYHPAAALYNGSMRQTLLDDFANIPIILKKIT